MPNTTNQTLFKSNGTYLGFVYNGSVFSRDGIYLGWVEGVFVWDTQGKFRGQIINLNGQNYVLLNKFLVQPVPKTPKTTPNTPNLPPPPPNTTSISLPVEWVDSF